MNKRRAFLYAVFLLACAAVSLVLMECVLRKYFRDTAYIPGEQTRKAQSYLVAHPRIGYLYKKDISQSEHYVINQLGVEEDHDAENLLVTDENGFLNPPVAIARKRRGDAVIVVGLGDSFMHDAAYAFYHYCDERGVFYYNLSMHRHCPPQYNEILKEFAVPLRPHVVIYGLYTNDFEETEDFEQWRTSGMDWFAYHSGTWAGPPLDLSSRGTRYGRIRNAIGNMLIGHYTFLRYLRYTCYPAGARLPGDDQQSAISEDKVALCIREAAAIAEKNNILFIVLLIPDKEYVLYRQGADKDKLYQRLISVMEKHKIWYVDLSLAFCAYPNRRDLYYKEDYHWNNTGMRIAAEEIWQYIQRGHGR